jgi:hypothetical protein
MHRIGIVDRAPKLDHARYDRAIKIAVKNRPLIIFLGRRGSAVVIIMSSQP